MKTIYLSKLVLPVILLLLTTSSVFAYSISGNVTAVFDGDTIKLNNRYKVRFYGIDAPEKDQEYGIQAKEYLSGLISGKKVMVRYVDKDQYGRVVGKVFYQGDYINLEMVKMGYAWYYKRYAPGDTYFATAQRYAIDNKLGLWKQESPIPPWDWRRGGGRYTSSGGMIKQFIQGFLYSVSNMSSGLITGIEKLDIISSGTAYKLRGYSYTLRAYSRSGTGVQHFKSHENKLARLLGIIIGYCGIFVLLGVFLRRAIRFLSNKKMKKKPEPRKSTKNVKSKKKNPVKKK